MKKRLFLLFAFILLLAGFGRRQPGLPKADPRPNIIIIVADDLGFSDLGCYGGEIATPNLDALARRGARLTSFYNTARCCPTRASLLTGLYPHQAGVGRMTTDEGVPGYRGSLTPNTVTIAEVLRSAGYQTGMVGKWHLSETVSRPTKEEHLKWLAHQAHFGDFADPKTYPTARGFDRFYGTIWGVVDFFDPFSLVWGTKPVQNVPADFYYTNAIGDSAVAFVDHFTRTSRTSATRSSATRPFFLYVAHTAPHWPLQALPEDIRKYENTYRDGWQALRQRRYQRLVTQKLIDPATTPLPAFMYPKADWDRDSTQAWDARAMAVHAAMVDRLDQTVGKLVTKLRETGQLDNTLILFMSDNGASAENPSAYGPGFDRAGSTRDGRTVAFPTKKEVMPGGQLVHAGIGDIWAHAVNTPFRYYKAKLHEGGITTPLIAHWPKSIRPGGIINEPTHVIDLMPTCLALAQTPYPATYSGRTITPSPGKSLVPLLKAGKAPAQRIHPTLFWEHFGAAAFREGDWKIVRLTQNDPWELYDLKRDRSETTNLAGQHPDRVAALAQQWEAQAHDYQVYPKPGKK